MSFALRDSESLLTPGRDEPVVRALEGSWLLGAVVDGCVDAIVCFDCSGTILLWNAAAERLFGYRGEDVIGKPMALILPAEEDRGGGEGARIETTRWAKDGRRIAVSITISPVRNRDGSVVATSQIYRELTGGAREADRVNESLAEPTGFALGELVGKNGTDLTHPEDGKLRHEAELFSAVFHLAPICVYIMDGHFRMVYVNPSALPTFATIETVIGRHFFDLLCILYGDQIGAELAGIFRHTMETGERYVSPKFIAQRADLAVERVYEWEIQRIPLPDGQHRLVCYFRDVTESCRTERLLLESEHRFREMIDALPTAVYTTDAEGRVTHYNPAAVAFAGRTPELGTDRWCISWRLFLADGTPLAHKDWPMATALREGRIVRGAEVILERPDGTRVWFTPFPTPLRDGTGKIVGGINMLMDITERKQAEAAQRESEARIRLTTEAIAVGIWECNLVTGVIRWDREVFRIYGIEPTADMTVPFSAWSEAVLPEDLPGQEEALRSTIQRKERGTREFRIRRPGEAETRYIQAVDTVRTNAEGTAEWILGSNVDVTEQKRAALALQTSEARLRLGVDVVGMALAEVEYGSDTVHLSEEAARMFGLGDAVMTISLGEIFATIHEDDQEEFARRNVEALDPSGDGLLAMDFRLVGPTSELRWVRLRGQVSFEGAEGMPRPIRGVLAALDITTEKAAEVALRVSEQRFRQLADTMPQLVWSTRADGYTDLYNEKWYEYTGLPYEALEGVRWTAVIHPEDLPGMAELWQRSLRSGYLFEAEARYRRYDGVYRWCLVRATAILDEQGRVVRWFGTSTDVHEQKRLEVDLRRANRDLESFAFTASHDLQEPLRNVAIYGQLFKKRYGTEVDALALEYLGYMIEGVQRMSELVRDLLAYTQAGDLDSDTLPVVSAESVLEKVLLDLRLVLITSRAVITHDPLPLISMKEVHLHAIFQNLIANALKYAKDGLSPVIHVSAALEDAHWQFAVKDNGIGMSPEYHEKVFGIFKRLHAKGSKYSGTGIGLAICQKTIERYEGRIWVDSTLGEGSTFYFTVPEQQVALV